MRVKPYGQSLDARPCRALAHVAADVGGNRCAMSGLRLINGGGRPEVQAAHIRPVASDGPDSVRNGLALSGTLHWMFDRGLVSLDDEFRILRARNLPDDVGRLILPNAQALLPNDAGMKPHPAFLRFHREFVFKG